MQALLMNNISHRIAHAYSTCCDHPCTRFTNKVVVEVIKVWAIKFFLESLARKIYQPGKVPFHTVYDVIAFSPFWEEMIFRFLIHNLIHLSQLVWNSFHRFQLTDQDRKIQQFVRVQISALIFAAVHLRLHHSSWQSKLIQFTWSYIGGVAYAYLYEKTHTLASGLLLHGINNTLVLASMLYPQYAKTLLIAIFVNKIGAFLLVTDFYCLRDMTRQYIFRKPRAQVT